MIIYHGSTDLVNHPEIRQSEVYLDFGIGFYTTTSYEQASRWAKIKMRRSHAAIGYVSVYAFDLEQAEKDIIIRRFQQADMAWLTFVVGSRTGQAPEIQADMTIGPVADDNVYQSIRLFETGVLDAADTVKRLKTEVLHDQWTFHTAGRCTIAAFSEQKQLERSSHDETRSIHCNYAVYQCRSNCYDCREGENQRCRGAP